MSIITGGLNANNVALPACGPIDYFPRLTQEEYDNTMLYSIENKLTTIFIFPTDFASKTNTTQRSNTRSYVDPKNVASKCDVFLQMEQTICVLFASNISLPMGI